MGRSAAKSRAVALSSRRAVRVRSPALILICIVPSVCRGSACASVIAVLDVLSAGGADALCVPAPALYAAYARLLAVRIASRSVLVRIGPSLLRPIYALHIVWIRW